MVFYESPHRIEKTLHSLGIHTPTRTIILARELTKVYEEFLFGTATELLELLASDPHKKKGEFVVLVSPK